MAFIYHPNGVIVPEWTPQSEGKDYQLSPTLKPLEKVKQDFQVISGLDHHKAQANGDGGGDHARANATFLTGCQARKTDGADIKLGISVDQIAAEKLRRVSRFPSLELSCDKSRMAGRCDSGYSCAYQYNMSWKSDTLPLPPENDPRALFERLFAGGSAREQYESLGLRHEYGKSILDCVLEDAKALQGQLGSTDRRKVDEYLTSVRELETRIEAAEQFASKVPDYDKPAGIPRDYATHIRTMFDLMALAFQTDSTRISTFLVAHDGSNKNYPEIGVHEGHHKLSHHRDNEDWVRQLAKIDKFHIQQFAYFLEKLKSIPEGDGNLLDNCMIVYGGGISDGNRHRHTDLPVLLAGHGGGTLNPGRHWRVPGNAPMTNLYMSMLDRIGTPVDRIGDSTGKLTGI